MPRFLVIAHQTALSPELEQVLLARQTPATTFTLLVPATPVEHLLTWEEGETYDLAAERAANAFQVLTRAGIRLTSAKVGAASPLTAIAEELAAAPEGYDGIIISTHPSGISRWLKTDVVRQTERRFGLPVIHVEAVAGQVASEPAGCPHDNLEPIWDETEEEGRVVYRCADCGEPVDEAVLPGRHQAWRP